MAERQLLKAAQVICTTVKKILLLDVIGVVVVVE